VLRSSTLLRTAVRGVSFTRLANKTVRLPIASRSFLIQRSQLRLIERHFTVQARSSAKRAKDKAVAAYAVATVIAVVGLSYAAVPLYRIFCAKTGFGGTANILDVDYAKKAKPLSDARQLTIRFQSQVADGMPWKFWPQQKEVKVQPGEAALAFFAAENTSDEPIIGVSTYNIQPDQAGFYFNKIQCFCFEEQRLNPHEVVDMPVFFFVDPDALKEKALRSVDVITLSYTFFKASDAEQFQEELQKNQELLAVQARHQAAKQKAVQEAEAKANKEGPPLPK